MCSLPGNMLLQGRARGTLSGVNGFQEGKGYELPYCEGLRRVTASIKQMNVNTAPQARTLKEGCIVLPMARTCSRIATCHLSVQARVQGVSKHWAGQLQQSVPGQEQV